MEKKKILFIVAPKDFRDEELFVPKQYFEQKNLFVQVASTEPGIAKGKLGGQVKIDLTLEQAKAQDFDGIIFVGGPGTLLVRQNLAALELVKKANQLNKIIGAICWAPTILAKAGVLKGKKATCWVGQDSEYGLSTSAVLEKFGAKFVSQDVVIDGKIITADGPASAKKFAQEIFRTLTS